MKIAAYRNVTKWPATLLLGVLVGASLASANVITVATADPDVDPDGVCSLIEAIENANNDDAGHADCAAGSGPDTIVLPTDTHTLTAELTEDNGLPLVSTDITVEGNGATIERASGVKGATALFRIFEVSMGGSLTLDDLTIRNGQPDGSEPFGGGVRNNGGVLSLNGTTVLENSAVFGGGISAEWPAMTFLVDSTVSGNTAEGQGGGLWIQNDLFIEGSEVSGNTAAVDGGGIFLKVVATHSPFLSLIESTVSDNIAGEAGGGILIVGGQFQIDRSTISGNTAGAIGDGLELPVGGGIAVGVALGTINNSTLSGNQNVSTSGTHFGEGGAIALTTLGEDHAIVNITNSTLANNTAPEGGEAVAAWEEGGGFIAEARFRNTILELSPVNPFTVESREQGAKLLCRVADGAAIFSDGHNLASDDSCALEATGDVQNKSALLEPLADNGGPTLTHNLDVESQAVNSGSNVPPCPSTDQRLEARPAGLACDKGAVELGEEFLLLFEDGFESGDTSAWSTTVP